MTHPTESGGKNHSSDIIKKVPLDISAYANKLRFWIIDNQGGYFEYMRATHWRDFDYFDSKKTVTRREFVMPNEHLLIDRDFEGEHWYVICQITGNVRNKARVTHIHPVIKISELDRNFWRNGYFLLPSPERL